ncbi:MAG: flagellar hook protein FlgE [Gemmatimonadetes bacterium]|nr:flagellar hook protein FlgE [Gemmatimonadota bacterium]
MMRSLFAGVSGLRNHQVRLDVIGNNIANVNTVGFKSSRVTFKEAFAQLVQGASKPSGSDAEVQGGTNPVQVGLGMNIGSIDLQFTQGNLENTGIVTDLAIQGDSFFVVSDGQQRFYTRSGNFQLEASGRLVSATNGYVVQGRMATNGVLSDTITDIMLPFGQKAPAAATTVVSVGGNLRADAPIYDPADPTTAGGQRQTSISIYDSQGAKHDLTITFTKTGNNTWDYKITASGVDGSAPAPTGDTGTLTFNPDGSLNLATPPADFVFTPDGIGAAQTIKLDFGRDGDISGLSQFAAPSTAVIREQDGYTMGLLERISIDPTGTITGAFTNGVTQTLGQIVLADFNNPAGLVRIGNNMYAVSANSGAPVLGYAGEGSQSTVTSGALEMSNVDLAQEFTNMITAQRGFQSNARVITASDEMLQELVNLKR